MKTVVRKLYEAMFLIDSAEAAANWEGINSVITNILDKADAEIVSIRKWDECKLAYDINGKSRGTYILCYFRANGERIRQIERDVQLSERIMRVLILSSEHMGQEDIEKDTPATQAEKHREKIALEAAERAEAAAEKSKAKQVSSDEPAEEAEEPDQSAEEPMSVDVREDAPVLDADDAAGKECLETTEAAAADSGESEQPEQKESKDLEQTDEPNQEEVKEN